MQKLSLKKMSVLGLVLMGASALTAAVVPADKKDKENNNNGRLAPNSATAGGPANIVSCVAASSPLQCTATAGSATTAGALTQSYVGDDLTSQTEGNTSQTLAIPDVNGVDQTSIVS